MTRRDETSEVGTLETTGAGRKDALAQGLQAALDKAHVSVENVSDRTKVPQSTLRWFLGETGAALLPARVYLRGHLLLVAREIGMDETLARDLFDAAYPKIEEIRDLPEIRRVSGSALALSAGLAGVGILAIILAFAS